MAVPARAARKGSGKMQRLNWTKPPPRATEAALS
jgi:hypothetical protein